MANSSSAKKRVRQANKNRTNNVSARSMMRSYIKRVHSAIAAGDKITAEIAYLLAIPIIDRVAGKGLIHANNAARTKSRLNNSIRAMA